MSASGPRELAMGAQHGVTKEYTLNQNRDPQYGLVFLKSAMLGSLGGSLNGSVPVVAKLEAQWQSAAARELLAGTNAGLLFEKCTCKLNSEDLM